MLNHDDVWAAIDALAGRKGLSVSALAKNAGLDPTTFNKSKRETNGGRPRWPSTESISKLLTSTGTSLVDLFADHIRGEGGFNRLIPVIDHIQAGSSGYFDDSGYPVGTGWLELSFPDVGDPNAYALEINGNGMEPVYRDGDLVVVSPAASLRRGDRVVARTKEGEVMAKVLARRSAQRVILISFNPSYGDRIIRTADIDWIARIIWATQ